MLCVGAERRGGLTGWDVFFLVKRVRANEETEFCGRRVACLPYSLEWPDETSNLSVLRTVVGRKIGQRDHFVIGERIGCCGIVAGGLAEVGEAQRSCKGGWGKAVPLQDRSIDQWRKHLSPKAPFEQYALHLLFGIRNNLDDGERL